MRKFLLASAFSLAGLGAAHAVPIAAGSTLSLNGSDSFTATSISFTNPGNIGGETGSFTALANCTGCVTLTSFTSTTTTPFTMYTALEGTTHTALSVSSDTFDFTPGTLAQLSVTGTGTLSLTGFDPTPGQFVVTTQGPTGVSVTFSVTSDASAVPEPATLGLLGVGLLGLGLVARQRRRG